MNQTEHVGLNQWDPEDRILRADFNADNAKLDAALAGKLGRLEEAVHINPSSGGLGSGYLSLTAQKPWSYWDCFAIVYDFPKTEAPGTLEVHFDAGFSASLPAESFVIILFPRHDDTRKVTGIILNKNPERFSCDFTYQQVTQLHYSTVSGPIPSPALTLIGVT